MNTDKYFYRNTIFSKSGNQVSIIDIENPEENRQKLEPWPGIVFQLADGQHTVEEMFNLLAQKYEGPPPQDLKKTIISVVERLAGMMLIVITDKKTELPYYLKMPYELMDIEKAKKQLAEDLLKHQPESNINARQS